VVAAIVGQVEAAYSPGAVPEQIELQGAIRLGSRARSALRDGRYDEAARIFAQLEDGDRYIRAGFDAFTYRYEFGRSLMRRDRKAEAQAQLAKAVDLRPDHAAASYNLGLVLARLQRPLEAEDAIRRAVELEPDNAERRARLVLQVIENGKLDDAREELARILERDADHEAAAAALLELGPPVKLADEGASKRFGGLFSLFKTQGREATNGQNEGEAANSAAAILRQSMAPPPRRAKSA
jgi:tetratricopeptide (TPR) repeat protein